MLLEVQASWPCPVTAAQPMEAEGAQEGLLPPSRSVLASALLWKVTAGDSLAVGEPLY